jgi:type I restriction enzyme S subunit
MNIKQGYKQTEIGIIPEDWEVKKLIDISQLITKGTTPKKFSEIGINFIKIECFEGNLINQEKCAFIDIITHSTELKRSILQEGDILFAIAGATIGKCNVVQSEILPANTNQALAIVRLKQNENREFVYRLLASYKMQKYITDNVSVGAQPNLNLEQIGNFLFAYPLFSEQTAIATALSDIDALIGELDKLIAKKQGIKQATMQQLLTGKKRLAGFGSTSKYKQTEIGIIPEDWEIKTLGDLLDFQGGSQPPKQTFIFQEKIGYIRLLQIRDYKGDKYETYIPLKLAKKICNVDDIMIGRYGPPIFQILNGLDGAYNVALIKAIPREEIFSKKYEWFILKQEKLFQFVEKLSQRSSGQTGVDLFELKKYQIPLPPLKEQAAIANILSDMDAEISQLEGRRAKMGELKQGMMQELLTGRIRLI